VTRSVLFVRSIPLPAARAALTALRRAAVPPRITVLTDEASVSRLVPTGLIDGAIIYRGTRFGLTAAGLDLIRQVREHEFDVVVVPYVGADRQRFWNVARLALAFAAPACVWMPCEGAAIPTHVDSCEPVRIGDWIRCRRPTDRIRGLLFAALTWPLLVAGSLLAIAMLAAAAAVLFPLVWLKPEPGHDD
jgi:hypothetical protein